MTITSYVGILIFLILKSFKKTFKLLRNKEDKIIIAY